HRTNSMGTFVHQIAEISKANAGAQLHLVPLEIVEVDRARDSGRRAPDLNVPRGRDKISFAERRVEGRADVECLPRETVEPEPVVVTKVARFRADEDAGASLASRAPLKRRASRRARSLPTRATASAPAHS